MAIVVGVKLGRVRSFDGLRTNSCVVYGKRYKRFQVATLLMATSWQHGVNKDFKRSACGIVEASGN